MAKGRVSGGTPLNIKANLDINQAKKNALDLIKTLNDIKTAASSSGINPTTGVAKIYDVKPLSEYQAGLLKIKQDALDLAKQNAAKSEERRNQLDAEKKAAQEKSSAEKSASLAVQAALKEETRIKREQIDLQKEQAALARKTGPFPGGFAERQFQNPPKLGSSTEPVKNLTLSYSELIKKYNAQTNSIDANNAAYSKLSTELAKQAAAQGTLTNGVLTSTTALRQNSSAEDDSYVKKGKSALLIAEQTAIQAKATAELKNFVRETNNEKGSLEQRKAALIRLTVEYGKLTVAQRNSSSGTRLANTITGLTNQIKDIQKFGSEANLAAGKIVDLKNKLAFFQDALTRAQAPRSFVNLNRKIEETRLALERLNNAGKKGFDSLGNKDPFDSAKTRQATADLKNYVRETSNAKGSIEQRKAALERLSTAYVKLSAVERDSAAGTRMAKIIKDLTEKIKELEAALGRGSSSGSSDFFSSIKDNILGVIGPLALLTAAYQSIKELFSHNVEISDNFVDVQRTAKLSADEVDRLGDKLKNINTRTSLEGLLEIGFIGGRLGVAKDDLVGFIKEVDELAVVLKKEFPGGAEAVATSLGKVISVYKITQKEGITLQTALRKTGSAFLELSHNGGAPVQFLQDFALGTAGIAQVVKLQLPTLLAYGSVLSKAGLTATTAATGVTRFLSDLSTKREKYFAIAQLADSTLTIEKFTNLINTDAKQALELFFKGLKSGNPTTTETGDRLKTLSLTAGKVKNTVIALSEATDTLFTSTKLINKAYDEGTSSNHNFELANNSLAASIDKIKNSLVNAFTSSAFSRSLGNLLNAVTDNRTETEKLTEEYQNNKHSLDELEKSSKPLLEKYDQLKTKSKLTKDEQEELRSVTAKLGALYPGVITNMNDFGIALDINRGKITEMSKAQREMLELQNRVAIQAAKAQFNLAQSYIPEAKERALDPKKTNSTYNKIYDTLYGFLGGEDRKTAADIDAKDRVTRLSAKSYEAAKAVRDLGGTLTAAEKKVIDYYEALDKKPKQEATILQPEGEDLNDERTVAKIKAELKTLILSNSTLGIETDKYQANLKKIKELRVELKKALGTESKSEDNKYQVAVTARNSLQEKITQLTNAGLNKQLSADDAEVESVREKYRKMGADIEEFNRKYKGKVKVDSSGLVTAEKTEVQGVIDKQSNSRFKSQLADQTKDFEEFENYKLKYGLDAAQKRYKTEYTTAEAYAQKLEDVQTNILNKYGDPTGYSEAQKQELEIATNEIIAFNEKRKGIDDESYSRAYETALTNAQKLAQINKEYELNRIALGKNATTEQLANLQRERDEKIRGQNEVNVDQKTKYADLLENLDAMTRAKAIEALEAAKLIYLQDYKNKLLTARQYADKVAQINGKIDSLTGNNIFNKIAKSIELYKKAAEQFKNGKGTAIAVDTAKDNVFDSIGQGAQEAIGAISELGSLFDELGIGGEKLQQVLKGVSGILDGAGKIAEGISKGNPVAVVTGAIKLLTSAISLFNNKDKNLQKKIDGYKKQLDDLGNSYKQLERQVANSVGESVYSDQAKEIENLQKQQQLLIQSRDAEGQKKKKDQGKIDEYNNQINDIPNKIDDINKAISQNLIQGTFKDLSNSLADAFAEAFKAGENGIEKMDDVFKNFIGNAIKNSLKLKILDPVVKNFTDDLTQYAKDNNNSIVGFDFDKWKSQLKEAGDQFNAGLKVSEQFFKPDSEKPSSVGTIRAELTEQTGGKLEGLWRGQFDMTKSLVALSTERNAILIPIGKSIGDYFNLARASFDVIVQTEVNTRRTADNTDDLSKKLDQIISNTKGGPTARGSGYQSI